MSNEEIVKTTARIPRRLWSDVKKGCVDLEMDLSDAINKGLEMWLSAQRNPSKTKPHNAA